MEQENVNYYLENDYRQELESVRKRTVQAHEKLSALVHTMEKDMYIALGEENYKKVYASKHAMEELKKWQKTLHIMGEQLAILGDE